MSSGAQTRCSRGQNGEQLGVRPASKIYVDDSDGIAKRAWAHSFSPSVRHSLTNGHLLCNVSVTLSPTRPILRPRSASAVRLSAIELLYTFRTHPLAGPQRQDPQVVRTRSYYPPFRATVSPPAQPPCTSCCLDADAATAADPFSPHAFLPLVAALDRTVEKFAVLHLVRCARPSVVPGEFEFDRPAGATR